MTQSTGCSSVWLECCVRDAEVAGSNPVIPTIFRIKPFGHQVEGLSPFRDKRYVVERKVQTQDFEYSSLRTEVRRNPSLPKALRKFKRFDRDVDGFVPSTVSNADFEFQFGLAISKFEASLMRMSRR